MRPIDQPLSPKELATFEAGRDLGAELQQSVREMKAGMVRAVYDPASLVRTADDHAHESHGVAANG